MNIVIDSNIFIPALIKDGKTRHILLNKNLKFLLPEFVFEEIFNHQKEILIKSKLTVQEFNILLSGLLEKVTVIRVDKIISFRKKAQRIIENIDKDDVIFIATALAFSCPIWSDDKHLKQQNIIKILTTGEMIESTQ